MKSLDCLKMHMFKDKLMIFLIKSNLFPEFPLQTHDDSFVQIHKSEMEEIRFDPYSLPPYLVPHHVICLPNVSIGYSPTSPCSGPHTTITACSDNQNHLFTATLLPSLMHITARGIFSKHKSDYVPLHAAETFQWFLSTFKKKTMWLSTT